MTIFTLLLAAVFPATDCLWYDKPAYIVDMAVPWSVGKTPANNSPSNVVHDPWESQTLPIGNGRVGATMFGGDARDRIQLNEISLWTGGENLPGNGSGYSYGPKSGRDQFGAYQPFGNLVIDYLIHSQATTGYARALALKKGIHYTTFENNGVKHMREAFVSRPDEVFVYSARADKPGSLSARIGLMPCHDVEYTTEDKTLIMRGTLVNGEKFEGRVLLKVNGGKGAAVGKAYSCKVEYEGAGDFQYPTCVGKGIPYLIVKDADSFELIVSLATDYKEDFKAGWKGEDPSAKNKRILSAASKKNLNSLRARHTADHGALYNRMTISLGKTAAEIAALPTDRRIERYRAGATDDPELETLVYQYGRYVLIAGSRPGNLPVTLQGIWNDKVHAAWACDYHNNINLQMCYWGAEVANLSECHKPFIDYMQAMEEPLTEMTKKQFGPDIKGWTTRISQNIWGAGGWVMWNPPVNAWYMLHVWDHFLFTGDKKYLRETGYPVMKSVCEFWESRLKETPEGTLVSPQGWSHEWGPTEDGISHDQQLIWEVFDNTAKAAKILGVDSEWAKKLLVMRDKLEKPKVSPNGYLQEWRVDRPNMVSGHRHTSHLIGVYPGTMLWKQPNTSELISAAKKSLELRGCGGDNRRSWTWPWRTALWARFGDSEQAYEMVRSYLRYNCFPNLFGIHPPMQMDGTYGITGGMSEMFVQSQSGEVILLPALPKAWLNGKITGIKARGNLTIDMEWKNGKVTDYKITSSTPKHKPVKIIVNGEKKTLTPNVW